MLQQELKRDEQAMAMKMEEKKAMAIQIEEENAPAIKMEELAWELEKLDGDRRMVSVKCRVGSEPCPASTHEPQKHLLVLRGLLHCH